MSKVWWSESLSYLPEATKAEWLAEARELEATEPSDFLKSHSQWMFNMVKMINEEKITLMAGTDTPIAWQTPGISLHNELAMLVKAGLTPLDAIQCATLNPAKYFNLDNELGLIRENYLADLIILNKNPLTDIENTKSIFAVLKQGKYYDRKSLDAILAR